MFIDDEIEPFAVIGFVDGEDKLFPRKKHA